MPTPFTIRRLDALLPEIVDIHKKSFDPGWSKDSFQDFLGKSTTRLYVCERDGVTQAFVLTALTLDQCEVLTFATDPQYRRTGAGMAVFAHMMREASAEGASAVYLEVARDNAEAIPLYEHFGFHQAGVRKAYYAKRHGPPVDALVFRYEYSAP